MRIIEQFSGIKQFVKGIDHIAVAVNSLDDAITLYTTLFRFDVIEKRETKGEFSGMISATMVLGGVTFVFVQATSKQSNVSQYIKHYGTGIQHVALQVKNISAVYKTLKDNGVEFLSDIITGENLYQAFTIRDKNSGLMIELIERGDVSNNFSDDNVQKLFESMERLGVY